LFLKKNDSKDYKVDIKSSNLHTLVDYVEFNNTSLILNVSVLSKLHQYIYVYVNQDLRSINKIRNTSTYEICNIKGFINIMKTYHVNIDGKIEWEEYVSFLKNSCEIQSLIDNLIQLNYKHSPFFKYVMSDTMKNYYSHMIRAANYDLFK
jgi:hypothetical protein